jgi:hypothetical protein
MRVFRLIPTLTVLPSSCLTTTAEPPADCTTPWTDTVALPEWETVVVGGPLFDEDLPWSAYNGAANASAAAARHDTTRVFDRTVTSESFQVAITGAFSRCKRRVNTRVPADSQVLQLENSPKIIG